MIPIINFTTRHISKNEILKVDNQTRYIRRNSLKNIMTNTDNIKRDDKTNRYHKPYAKYTNYKHILNITSPKYCGCRQETVSSHK